MNLTDRVSRRLLLTASAGAPAFLAAGRRALAQGGVLEPTPRCDDGPTLRQTEGPFFKPRSPKRATLRQPGAKGTPLKLAGLVVTRACNPVRRALVDLWHADADGQYDNVGFRFRGHQFTDAEGFFRFETIVPGLYAGRTRHFHVNFQAPGVTVLTTQLYFPWEPANARDALFSPQLLLAHGEPDRPQATFVAVLDHL